MTTYTTDEEESGSVVEYSEEEVESSDEEQHVDLSKVNRYELSYIQFLRRVIGAIPHPQHPTLSNLQWSLQINPSQFGTQPLKETGRNTDLSYNSTSWQSHADVAVLNRNT